MAVVIPALRGVSGPEQKLAQGVPPSAIVDRLGGQEVSVDIRLTNITDLTDNLTSRAAVSFRFRRQADHGELPIGDTGSVLGRDLH